MMTTSTFADRWSGLALRLIAALNLIFLAFFLAGLTLSVRDAAGEEVVCTGQDMIAEFEKSDPALLETVRKQAAQVENGSHLLWRIEKPGAEPSYLFGTMHMTDPRVVSLPPQAQRAFDAADTVIIETTDILDQKRVMAAFAERPELTMFTDGESLESLLAEDEIATLREGLARRGIPFDSVRLMKPWMLSALVALPACEMSRKAAGAVVLDQKLAEDAKAAGKAVDGLETINDQLGAMASLPIEFHTRSLVETLKLGNRMDDVMETMIALYLRGETGMYWPFFRAVLPGAEDKDGGFAAFQETMITARNRTMAQRSEPFIDKGGAFIAVGALHLPGEDGLVTLLEERGYAVKPVD